MVGTQELTAHLHFFNHSSLPFDFVLCPAILPAVGTSNFDVSASNQQINILKRALKADGRRQLQLQKENGADIQ